MFRLNVSSRVEMSNAVYTSLQGESICTFPSAKYNESVVDALTMVQSLRKTIYLAIEKFRVCSRSDTFPCVDESRFFFSFFSFFLFFFLPAIGNQRWGSVNREAAIETSAISPFVWAEYFSQREKELKKKKKKYCSHYHHHYTFPTLYDNESPGLLITLVKKTWYIYVRKIKKGKIERDRNRIKKSKKKKKKIKNIYVYNV